MAKRFRVLIVEDNLGDQFLIEEGFRKCGATVELHFAKNGIEAMAMLAPPTPFSPSPPHLILLDLNLVLKDGREVLGEVKRDPRLQKIPVVVFSTSNSLADIENAYALGANAYLVKPGDLMEFMDTIQVLSKFWLGKASLLEQGRGEVAGPTE